MRTLEIKEKHKGSVIDRIVEAKQMINYHKKEIVPHYEIMEAWERKEYEANLADYTKEFEELKASIIENQKPFNIQLSEYNFSVATFVYYLNHILK